MQVSRHALLCTSRDTDVSSRVPAAISLDVQLPPLPPLPSLPTPVLSLNHFKVHAAIAAQQLQADAAHAAAAAVAAAALHGWDWVYRMCSVLLFVVAWPTALQAAAATTRPAADADGCLDSRAASAPPPPPLSGPKIAAAATPPTLSSSGSSSGTTATNATAANPAVAAVPAPKFQFSALGTSRHLPYQLAVPARNTTPSHSPPPHLTSPRLLFQIYAGPSSNTAPPSSFLLIRGHKTLPTPTPSSTSRFCQHTACRRNAFCSERSTVSAR